MAVYEKASGEYPMNAGFYGAPGIAATGTVLLLTRKALRLVPSVSTGVAVGTSTR